MAKVKNKPIVVLVSAESLKVATPTRGIVEARYIRERDEPAFERTWERIRQLKAQGDLKPVPVPPIGGIRLRGSREKQSA